MTSSSGSSSEDLERTAILPERLAAGRALVAGGNALAADWTLESCAFLDEFGVSCEADHKRAETARGRVMQHAQLGFRDPAKSRDACARVYEACRREGATLDRYGLCLDWSMGYPRAAREGRPQGTGMILEGPEDFAALTAIRIADEFMRSVDDAEAFRKMVAEKSRAIIAELQS